MAKLFARPVFIRPFGGSLDQFLQTIPAPIRKLYLFVLKRTNGVIVETELLYNFFHSEIAEKVSYIPGYRHLPDQQLHHVADSDPTRFIFVGHVRAEKGVFTLLEAFDQSTENVHCDIYGPIYPETREKFLNSVDNIKNVSYKGILDAKKVVETMGASHVFVFPTAYQGEGHPGVVIEAMIAGLPIITTKHRSIPEIVEDGTNGLLIEPGDSAGEFEYRIGK